MLQSDLVTMPRLLRSQTAPLRDVMVCAGNRLPIDEFDRLSRSMTNDAAVALCACRWQAKGGDKGGDADRGGFHGDAVSNFLLGGATS